MLISEGVDYAVLDAKAPEDLTEEEKTSMLGRPRLGDVTKIQIRIRESKEFKVCRLHVQNQGLKRVSHNYLDWAKYQNRHSSKSI